MSYWTVHSVCLQLILHKKQDHADPCHINAGNVLLWQVVTWEGVGEINTIGETQFLAVEKALKKLMSVLV